MLIFAPTGVYAELVEQGYFSPDFISINPNLYFHQDNDFVRHRSDEPSSARSICLVGVAAVTNEVWDCTGSGIANLLPATRVRS